MARERVEVWQLGDLVAYIHTVLEVLPGGDNAVRDRLNRGVGERGGYAVGCALSPDGTCRYCFSIGPDGSCVPPGPSYGIDASITFKGSQLSSRFAVRGRSNVAGTYKKVADDPGPFPTPTTPESAADNRLSPPELPATRSPATGRPA